MENMKKFLLLMLFVNLCISANADIVDTLIEKKYSTVIHPYGSTRYVGNLDVENGTLKLSHSSDSSIRYPTIMAHAISADSIQLIIKSRGYPWDKSTKGPFNVLYYKVKLYLEKEEIAYTCYWIEEPILILDGYAFTEGTINERFVNIRKEPSTKSGIFGKLNRGSKVTATAVSKNAIPIALMYDYWIQISINDTKYWVYGYYVDFSREIKLK
jgi:uncharacterized protein YgiM (DUF1202 family)